MARPSTRTINKFNVIQQFQRWGITAVINLQHPGEHANCGFGLENSGFTYNPEAFMDNGIFFYNFIW
ncbi:tyrosine phosphatase domain-containing 1 isoform X2 [Paramuricea clavata]|uniref:Tyrosine phosphatase domain-containing 1 isoform X2 n=1 Tax=Paramuricea clavata TaxID=317549 RepID=A0A6S7JYX3_PARCT|nr:tyrosine phosphatase domain-containing 1 isoform X2 [Paramuricea clavata]